MSGRSSEAALRKYRIAAPRGQGTVLANLALQIVLVLSPVMQTSSVAARRRQAGAAAVPSAASATLAVLSFQPNTDAQTTADAFTAATGIKVDWVRDGTPLIIAKLQSEIAAGNPQPDVLLISDVVTIEGLKQAGFACRLSRNRYQRLRTGADGQGPHLFLDHADYHRHRLHPKRCSASGRRDASSPLPPRWRRQPPRPKRRWCS